MVIVDMSTVYHIHNRVLNTKALTSLMFTGLKTKAALRKPLWEKRIFRMWQIFQIEAFKNLTWPIFLGYWDARANLALGQS